MNANQIRKEKLVQHDAVQQRALQSTDAGACKHRVGYDAPRNDAALVNDTLVGPYFNKYRDCEYAKEWFVERDAIAARGCGIARRLNATIIVELKCPAPSTAFPDNAYLL